MGEIYYALTINGNRTTAKVNALLDTGSIHNVVGYELSDGRLTFDIGFETYDEQGAKGIETIDNDKPSNLGTVRFKSITVDEITITNPRFTTFVLAKIGDEAIIGHPLMQHLEMVLDLRLGKDTAKINRTKA